MKKIIVAIDGPAASGKSSTARRLARSLGYVYIDSGAMYRACALAAIRAQLDIYNTTEILHMLSLTDIRLEQSEAGNKVILNGEDVSEAIRSEEISRLASDISAIPIVRDRMVELQRQMALEGGVVMDGRDIGTVVFPQAEVKFFMIADVCERAKRRFKELQDKGIEADIEIVLSELRTRDENDTNRKVAPLKPAPDSILIDTSHLSLDEQVAILRQHIKQRVERQ
ncbi:MAG TPA: (d)CMP kinase [Candidatus Cloacimonadota bacterium]|nr:(d)CMP kinase [Candidatus Cloacimonadota bacterium]